MAGMLAAQLSDSDIRFMVETVDPRLLARLDIIKGDTAMLEGILDQEADRLFQRLMLSGEDRMVTSASPRLIFEVLLRRARKELETQTYTVEHTAGQAIPVFDTREVAQFLGRKTVLRYLAHMLSSFTRTESFVLSVRVRKGIWRKIRFSDMDVDSLIARCEAVEEEHRFTYYKRIADLCLFVVGMFPEHAAPQLRPFATGETGGLQPPRRLRRSAADYEEEGCRFYQLAAEHAKSRVLDLEEVLWQLHERFYLATKPLTHISTNFLRFRKHRLFPALSAD